MAVGSNPREVLKAFEKKFIDALRKSLVDSGRDSTHELWNSIDAETFIFGQRVELHITMNDYWKFMDKGVDGYKVSVGSPYKYKNNGKPIPYDAMLKFIGDRNIQPTMSIAAHKKSIVTTKRGLKRIDKKIAKANLRNAYKSLAWALGRSIKKKGINPTHFASEVMEGNLIKEMSKEINLAVGREIKLTLANVL